MNKGRNTDQLALELLNTEPTSTQTKPHEFKHNKQLPLPKSPQKAKPLHRTQVVPPKHKEVDFQKRHCIPNQKHPLLYLEALKQHHIASGHFKERGVVTRNLELLSFQMQKWINSQLNCQIRPVKEEEPSFYQLVEKREERHFQIDRIIKYLSNF